MSTGPTIILLNDDVYAVLTAARSMPQTSKQALYTLIDDARLALEGDPDALLRAGNIAALLRGLCHGLYPPREERP